MPPFVSPLLGLLLTLELEEAVVVDVDLIFAGTVTLFGKTLDTVAELTELDFLMTAGRGSVLLTPFSSSGPEIVVLGLALTCLRLLLLLASSLTIDSGLLRALLLLL